MVAYSAKTTVVFKGPQMIGAQRVGAVRGVNLATERLRGHSVERAPIDLGDLREAATVEDATIAQDNPAATLVFDVPYATVQHEDETLHHTSGAHGEPAGESRYVAKNYEDAGRRAEYVGIIGKAVDDALRSA